MSNVAAAEEALMDAQQAEADAQAAFDDADAQVKADAQTADDAYTAYADCVSGANEPVPSALSVFIHDKYLSLSK